jgi:hypothetical protein
MNQTRPQSSPAIADGDVRRQLLDMATALERQAAELRAMLGEPLVAEDAVDDHAFMTPSEAAALLRLSGGEWCQKYAYYKLRFRCPWLRHRLFPKGDRVFAADWLALVRSIRKSSGQKDDWTSGLELDLAKEKARGEKTLATRTGPAVAPEGAPKQSPNYPEKPHKTPLRRRHLRSASADAALPGRLSLGNV